MKKKKKIFLLIEFISIIFLFILAWADYKDIKICSSGWNVYYGVVYYCQNIFWIISPVLPVFIFSLITYFLKDEIFKPWIKFTYWWLPLSIIFTLITPGGSGSFFVNIWDKEMTVIFMSGLYAIISIIMLIINVIRFYLLKKNKTDII